MISAVLDALGKEGKIENLRTGRSAKGLKVILSDKRDNKRHS